MPLKKAAFFILCVLLHYYSVFSTKALSLIKKEPINN